MKLITFLTTALIGLSVFAADIADKPVVRSRIDFGLVPHLGQRTRTLTLTNDSETPLTVISAKIYGSSFYLDHNCKKVLNMGESCSATITFWAVREGYDTGRLTVLTSDADYIVDLTGLGDQDPTAHLPPPPIPQPPRP